MDAREEGMWLSSHRGRGRKRNTSIARPAGRATVGAWIGVIVASLVASSEANHAHGARVAAAAPPELRSFARLRADALDGEGALRFGETVAMVAIGQGTAGSASAILAVGGPVDGDSGAMRGFVRIATLAPGRDGVIEVADATTLLAPDEGDHFGASLAFGARRGRHRIAIGADRTMGIGSVHVYESMHGLGGTGPRRWNPIHSIRADDAGAGADFGCSIAFSPDGEAIAAAARREDVDGASDAGTVRIFTEPGSVSVAPVVLHSPSPSASGWFGASVAWSGQWIAIGAPGEPGPSAASAGAVHLYRVRPGIGFVHAATLRSPDPAAHAWFGTVVAIDGTTLAVGEPRGGDRSGCVHLFDLGALATGSRAGVPQPTRTICETPGQNGAGLGAGIALDRGVLVACASGFDAADGRGLLLEDRGRAACFLHPDAGESSSLELEPPDPMPMGLFGASAALARLCDGSVVCAVGHLYVEEESSAPSAGVALYRIVDPVTGADTSARRSAASPPPSRTR